MRENLTSSEKTPRGDLFTMFRYIFIGSIYIIMKFLNGDFIMVTLKAKLDMLVVL